MRKTIVNCFKKSVLLGAGVLAFVPAPAEAEVFRWIDDAGMVHYSDYRSSIPVQYRDQVKGKVPPPVDQFAQEGIQQAKLTTGGEGQSLATGEGTKKEGAGKEGEGGKEGGGEGEEAGPSIDPELAKLLVETRDYLAHENAVYRRWIRAAKFDKEEGRFFVMLVHKHLPRKEELIKKIEITEAAKSVPVLNTVKFHLADEAAADKETKVGGKDYLERLADMERRLKSALMAKDEFVETLSKELEKAKVDEKLVAEMQKVIEEEEEIAKQTRPSSIKVEEVGKKKPKPTGQVPPPPGQ
ncbi:exported hypothetical protein [Nitrospina gracilis 3/211]|uniref:DUF4124 domain-containing protein n=1 Tax=Nitrospina gracilis (strain 3/211) TaxID=1266370 RepID=M1YZW3_NITG3|nr:DUF4124 domain-containing protein [Nitrospina gracilis]MCF8723911.1 hypothetical protein [Nitrospina sp. Nb-3]CCQ91033.1 exported hypothetical protein [Nitrospina gracilis 3/211]